MGKEGGELGEGVDYCVGFGVWVGVGKGDVGGLD